MHITIEDNKCIVNLDEFEFPLFEKMFANLQHDKHVSVEFRRFPDYGGTWQWSFAPMHLCRTIGEANLFADPFATVSLYPFWKHGFAFGERNALALKLGIDDPHKKGVAADEFGMGFCAWAMEEVFDCDTWADCSALISEGVVFPTGTHRPDFVCTFKDGSLGVFEGKGTTRTAGNLTGALADGKTQTQGITALDPIRCRIVVGAALGEPLTKLIIMDPDEADVRPTNLTADLVKRAAKRMRMVGARHAVPLPAPTAPTGTMETLFRGPRPQGARTGPEITLKRDEYRDDKQHGWLDIE